eukprot:4934240-Pyramimonas_sp.AAC.1
MQVCGVGTDRRGHRRLGRGRVTAERAAHQDLPLVRTAPPRGRGETLVRESRSTPPSPRCGGSAGDGSQWRHHARRRPNAVQRNSQNPWWQH